MLVHRDGAVAGALDDGSPTAVDVPGLAADSGRRVVDAAADQLDELGQVVVAQDPESDPAAGDLQRERGGRPRRG